MSGESVAGKGMGKCGQHAVTVDFADHVLKILQCEAITADRDQTMRRCGHNQCIVIVRCLAA
jgi:hypothetical protein